MTLEHTERDAVKYAGIVFKETLASIQMEPVLKAVIQGTLVNYAKHVSLFLSVIALE